MVLLKLLGRNRKDADYNFYVIVFQRSRRSRVAADFEHARLMQCNISKFTLDAQHNVLPTQTLSVELFSRFVNMVSN